MIYRDPLATCPRVSRSIASWTGEHQEVPEDRRCIEAAHIFRIPCNDPRHAGSVTSVELRRDCRGLRCRKVGTDSELRSSKLLSRDDCVAAIAQRLSSLCDAHVGAQSSYRRDAAELRSTRHTPETGPVLSRRCLIRGGSPQVRGIAATRCSNTSRRRRSSASPPLTPNLKHPSRDTR